MTFSIETAILDYLSKQDEPVRKSAIADNIPYTIGSIKNATPRLVKAGYIQESRGYYVITSMGRKHLEVDPFFTTRPKKKTSITIEIPYEELTNVSKRAIDQLTADQMKQYGNLLQTLAIMYAIAANVSLPKINNIPPVTEDEDTTIKNIAKFLQGE